MMLTSILRPRFSPWRWTHSAHSAFLGHGLGVGFVHCALTWATMGTGCMCREAPGGVLPGLSTFEQGTRVREGLGRVSGTSNQRRVAREAASVTSCLAASPGPRITPSVRERCCLGPSISLSAESRGHEARVPLRFVPGASSRGSVMFRHRAPRLNHRRRCSIRKEPCCSP